MKSSERVSIPVWPAKELDSSSIRAQRFLEGAETSAIKAAVFRITSICRVFQANFALGSLNVGKATANFRTNTNTGGSRLQSDNCFTTGLSTQIWPFTRHWIPVSPAQIGLRIGLRHLVSRYRSSRAQGDDPHPVNEDSAGQHDSHSSPPRPFFSFFLFFLPSPLSLF